jgi:hypothetical protein
MNRLRALARFLWDFVVGDDPRTAAGVTVAIALTWLLEHEDVTAWWLLPVAIPLLLADSLRRQTRRG